MAFGYVLREAVRGMGRNVTMTIALIITTSISLALLATGFLVTNMTDRTKDIYLDRVEVMIQLDEDTSANDPECTAESCTEVRDVFSSLKPLPTHCQQRSTSDLKIHLPLRFSIRSAIFLK